jgi:acetyl esterase/lipase
MHSARLKFLLAILAMFACSFAHARTPRAPTAASPTGKFCNPATGGRNNSLPANMCFQFNVAYGSDPLQKFDVYMPATLPKNAPVIVMVHGGGWYQGDKTDTPVVTNKVKKWVPAGTIFISINYRLVPKVNPVQQAGDVAMALGYAQRNAAQWGGDPNKFILMGFSAGAHLVSLVASSPSVVQSVPSNVRPTPWLGTISLDSAAYDVTEIMTNPYHDPTYDKAFGTDPKLWAAASPMTQLNGRIKPYMAVCSSREPDEYCTRAQDFVDKALGYGSDALVLPENLEHNDINAKLGLPSDYTNQVNAFMAAVTSGTMN